MAHSTIEFRDVAEGLEALSKAATRRKTEAFRQIKPRAKRDLGQRGLTQTGPDGKAWQAGSAASQRRARRDRRRNRQPGDLGKLTTAWKSQIEPEQLRFVNVIDYALIHHEGGRVGRGVKLPARPFGGFSPEFADKASKIWADMVLGSW